MAKRKATKRRATKKKAKARTTRKASRGKTSTKSAARPKVASAGDRARTKSQIIGALSENTGIARKDVTAMFDTMSVMIQKDLSRRGPGAFTVPGLMKIRVVRKPATKSRKGVNPFTGEPTVFKAKPAHNVVRIRPLKAMKEMVN